MDKPPYILSTAGPQAGRHASSTDPTWRPFEDAQILWELDNPGWDGVGIVLVAGLACVDLDGVINADGVLHPEAGRIVNTLGGYTEISPSGVACTSSSRGRCRSGGARPPSGHPARNVRLRAGPLHDRHGRTVAAMMHDDELPDRTAELHAVHAEVAAAITSAENGCACGSSGVRAGRDGLGTGARGRGARARRALMSTTRRRPGAQFGTIAARVTWPLSCWMKASLICSSGNLWETTRPQGYLVSVRRIRSSAPRRCSAS